MAATVQRAIKLPTQAGRGRGQHPSVEYVNATLASMPTAFASGAATPIRQTLTVH